eukprot:jgi/Galph1/4103/GphlegSOOS_G2786.1
MSQSGYYPNEFLWDETLWQKYSLLSFQSSAMKENKTFQVRAIINPLSSTAAKAATLLLNLRNHFDAQLSVLLLPPSYTSMESIRRASFYRSVLLPRPHFHKENGTLLSKPTGVFTNLPTNYTLTFNMDTPPKWLVGASQSTEDLDNLVLEQASCSHIFAEYELEALVVEGICMDVNNISFYPQGLSLKMSKVSPCPSLQDTLVMANLGYFQFQVNIGLWQLQVGWKQSPEQRYELVSIQHEVTENLFSAASYSSPSVDEIAVNAIEMNSFILYVRPVKKHSSQTFSWFSIDNKKKMFQVSWWKNILSPPQSSHDDNQTVHVFSLASGYLYERLIRIMMLSVVKHCSSPVKFWLLKNYLSPTFKKMLPEFAKSCGFQYQLVTYRWPAWLTPQTEKQRIMWAYKILFLDVLFPLNLSKIVFVDSDQVVRSDLKELFELDLHQAPYGYVPFCDSRKQVEGYRFWKQGFWASHLKGQKYRISALYVVDLKRFREMAAGDILRALYQRLVQDENSLSNLDQDLPNFASVPQIGFPHIPIHDLPQEWLWCETWCDDESKQLAKTIDLCNNPMTKEPKLLAAKRIIPEWQSLDEEAYAMVSKALEQDKKQSMQKNQSLLSATTDKQMDSTLHEEL